jgi:hypothetical protein
LVGAGSARRAQIRLQASIDEAASTRGASPFALYGVVPRPRVKLMVLGALLRRRRLPGALALAGMAFYAVLLPWHIASDSRLAQTAFELQTAHAARSSAEKPSPAKAPEQCPMCKDFAGFQLTLAGSAILAVIPREIGEALFDTSQDHLAESPVPPPQSRGPPHLPA